MEINITNGPGAISIGIGLGSYFRFKRPVAIIWPDCEGSVGQYLAVMPLSHTERFELQQSINNSLYEDYSGREEVLYEVLKPLFSLLDNGRYRLVFSKNTEARISYISSEPYEKEWYVHYAEVADRAASDNAVKKFVQHCKDSNREFETRHIIDYTSGNLYDWRNDVYIATRPREELNQERIAFFEDLIQKGERPFALMIGAEYDGGNEDTSYFVLDGHHKLAAYEKLDVRPPLVFITRVFSEGEQPEFDIEALAAQLYPWQTQHIAWHYDNHENIVALMQNPLSNLHGAVKHGYVEEFHYNGTLKRRGNYAYGNPEGIITEWYENGRLKCKRGYNDNKLVGLYQEWYPSGQLKAERFYGASGKEETTSFTFFEDGTMQSQTGLYAGQPDGYSFRRWHHNKKMQREHWATNGRITKIKNYNISGKLIQNNAAQKPEKTNYLFVTAALVSIIFAALLLVFVIGRIFLSK